MAVHLDVLPSILREMLAGDLSKKLTGPKRRGPLQS
jgi:hypothetical protein